MQYKDLANLLGQEVKHINQRAGRNNLKPTKSTQVLEIICDPKTEKADLRKGRGTKPHLYSWKIKDHKSLSLAWVDEELLFIYTLFERRLRKGWF